MQMKKSRLLFLAVLAAFSLLMSACTVPTAEQADEQPVVEAAGGEPAEECVSETPGEAPPGPTAEPTEEVSVEALLDENVSAFLSSMEGFNSTSPDDVSSAMGEGNAPFLIDVRNPSELEANGYIEGAVNIPLKELAQNVDKLPSPETPIVVYCGAGTRAAIGAMALGALGYTDVKAMMGGGFGGWLAAGYPMAVGIPEEAPILDESETDPAVVEAVGEALQSLPEGWAQLGVQVLSAELGAGAKPVLIDVRTPEEVAGSGQIEGAVNIPLQDMIATQGKWPVKNADVVVYCGVGYRGNLAMTILRAYGYENVRNLSGGFSAWRQADLPVAGSGQGADLLSVDPQTLAEYEENVQVFLNGMDGGSTISPADVNQAFEQNNSPFLIDIRTEEEVIKANGHYIAGAVSIPLELLAYNVARLPTKMSTPIVVYGASDTDAAIGAAAVAALGYTDVKSMQGGSFKGWLEADYPTGMFINTGPG